MATNPEMPQVGQDYPKNWVQFLDWFHSEEACRAYLDQLRWPDGFVCPKCEQHGNPCRSTRGRIICPKCKFQTTVTAGTIFDKTRTELHIWFAGIWYITNQKHGVSALGLQRVLGLGSYETAWTMLHRLRRAMVRPGRELLHGEVGGEEIGLSAQLRGLDHAGTLFLFAEHEDRCIAEDRGVADEAQDFEANEVRQMQVEQDQGRFVLQ